jgi:hypothetical protein
MGRRAMGMAATAGRINALGRTRQQRPKNIIPNSKSERKTAKSKNSKLTDGAAGAADGRRAPAPRRRTKARAPVPTHLPRVGGMNPDNQFETCTSRRRPAEYPDQAHGNLQIRPTATCR